MEEHLTDLFIFVELGTIYLKTVNIQHMALLKVSEFSLKNSFELSLKYLLNEEHIFRTFNFFRKNFTSLKILF